MKQHFQAAGVWQWVGLSFGFVGAMALALAHAPPAWHRPGPTAFWFSVVAGVVVGAIAAVHRIRGRGMVFAVAFLLSALAIAGMTGERYRMYDQALRRLYLSPPATNNPDSMRQTLEHGHIMTEFVKDFREERRRIYESKRPFPVYLRHRLQPLGISEPPWPFVFWLGEITIGSLAAALIAMSWQTWKTGPAPSGATVEKS